MNALFSPSGEKAAEANVRSALWLASPWWAEPSAPRTVGDQGWGSPVEATAPTAHTWP